MWIPSILVGLTLLVILIASLGGAYRLFLKRSRRRWRDRLVAHRADRPSPRIRWKECADLPAPVRRYLERAIDPGRSHVETVWMEQTGTFREATPTSPWNSFHATQVVRTRPPGFVWDASIQIMPLIPVHVLDKYDEDGGRLIARLGDVYTVLDARPGPAIDEGELLRYLGETPLYPTALLPERGVTWTSIDDRSARATLVDGDTRAALVFSFNSRNEVTRVTGRRPFLRDDGTTEYRPWTGYWSNYAERDGLWVPTTGEVAWILPDDGEVPYWRGRITSIQYNVGPADGREREYATEWSREPALPVASAP